MYRDSKVCHDIPMIYQWYWLLRLFRIFSAVTYQLSSAVLFPEYGILRCFRNQAVARVGFAAAAVCEGQGHY